MKEIQITQDMQSRIDSAAGTHVDPNSIAAFEAVAVSNLPIKKPGSIFNNATFDPSYFTELAGYLTSGKSVPLQVMHNSEVLPAGRVFHAAPTSEGARAQFYVPRNDPKIVQDINNGLIGSVSIGVMSKQLLCSGPDCTFDYRGPDATIMNFIDQTCPNGHTIGQNGVHLNQVGVDTWFEMSLCGTGASPGSLILSRAKAALAADNDNYLRLAANGIAPEAAIFVTPPTGDDSMTKEMTDRLEAQAVEIASLKATSATATASVTELTTRATTAETALTAATTAKTNAEAALLVANTTKETLETELAAAKTFLTDMTAKALVASGKPVEGAPTELNAMITVINASGAHLAQIVASGLAVGARKTTEDTVAPTGNFAFKTAPRS